MCTNTPSAAVWRQRPHDGCPQSLFKRPIGDFTCEFVIEPVKVSVFGRRIWSSIDTLFRTDIPTKLDVGCEARERDRIARDPERDDGRGLQTGELPLYLVDVVE